MPKRVYILNQNKDIIEKMVRQALSNSQNKFVIDLANDIEDDDYLSDTYLYKEKMEAYCIRLKGVLTSKDELDKDDFKILSTIHQQYEKAIKRLG